ARHTALAHPRPGPSSFVTRRACRPLTPGRPPGPNLPERGQAARNTWKSPLTVLLRMTTVGPDSPPGASESGTSEMSVPDADPASTSMLGPDAIPRSTSPDTLWTLTCPWRSEPTRTLPETDLTATEPSIDSARTLPDTARTSTSPVTRGSRTSP